MNRNTAACLEVSHDRLGRAIRLHLAGCPIAARRMLDASTNFLAAAGYDPLTAEPRDASSA
jgi:hypothetical protein